MLFKELRGNFPVAIAMPFVPAGGAGGGTFVVPNNFLITAASLVWGAAVTGAATNFFTASFFNRGPGGAGTVQFGTAIAYSNGINAAKATPVAITLSSTATDLQAAAGDVLTAEITTSGTGLIAPGGTLMLTGRWR
ncbi:MAG: hypothetical protein JWO11_4425 [Nocardioides sp.]|nr:hypothetical protein [Nocardioides sp.]